jgi:hypothetical protein
MIAFHFVSVCPRASFLELVLCKTLETWSSINKHCVLNITPIQHNERNQYQYHVVYARWPEYVSNAVKRNAKVTKPTDCKGYR